ncbi:MAG: hypothetical protein LBJ00_12735 [Planctomycetaceae bacterium]|nr:hypothetical protein [Planctomycetaceae bacterium]
MKRSSKGNASAHTGFGIVLNCSHPNFRQPLSALLFGSKLLHFSCSSCFEIHSVCSIRYTVTDTNNRFHPHQFGCSI